MDNPCKKCIVKAICRDGCEDLLGYLTEKETRNDTWGYQGINGNYHVIAYAFRKGSIELYENDRKWKWSR